LPVSSSRVMKIPRPWRCRGAGAPGYDEYSDKRRDGMEFDLRITVPGGLGNGVPEAFEEGVAKAARLFFESDNLRRLDVFADRIAAIIVGQVPPSVIQIDDLVKHMTRAQRPKS